MKENDVIVVGGGLTGLFAAIAAARRGRKVLVVTKGVGCIAIGGGTIDVIGYDAKGVALGSPLEGLSGLARNHPYSLIGRQTVEEAVQAFLSLCEQEGYPYRGNLHSNQWIPTALGTIKPSCLTPLTMDARDLKTAEEVTVIGFEGLKDFSTSVIADGLSRIPGYNRKYAVASLKTGLDNGRDISSLDIARWMESEKGRDSFIEQACRLARPQSMLLLPPVMGTRPNYEVFHNIEAATRCRIMETVGLPPAITGFRLRRMLANCLKKLNVQVIEQSNVIRASVACGRCHEIVTGNLDRERSYRAESFILATGGFIGGGLQASLGRVTEPVFNLSVKVPPDQNHWGNEHLFFSSGQPFAKFGLIVDDRLRPVDEAGNVLLENVYVAGNNLAGYDYCQEKSGNGVALATAWQAGSKA